MEPEEARWIRPNAPPDEELERPFRGTRPSALLRILAALLGILVAGILFTVFLAIGYHTLPWCRGRRAAREGPPRPCAPSTV